LAANARPLVGTTVDLVVSNIPVRPLLGAVLISLLQDLPGTDLGFLGMPGCSAHIDPFNNVTLGAFSPGGSSNSSSFAVVPGFSGVEVFFQAGLFVPGVNLQNLLVSNALTLRIGNI